VQDFDFQKRNPSKLLVQCRICTAYKKKYDQSAKGKKFWHNRNTSPAAAKNRKKWRDSSHGKQYMQEYAAAYEKLEKCKKRRRKWRLSVAGQQNDKNQARKANERRKLDPRRRLLWNIRVRMYSVLKGKLNVSATILRNTEFPTVESIRTHFKDQLTEPMTMENYGKVWDVEHTIAVVWYNHGDEEDVKRCWSKANLKPMLCKENMKKSYKIDDATVRSVDPEFWPKSWNGTIPSDERKREMYVVVRKGGRA